MSRGASHSGGLTSSERALALGAPALTALTLAAIVGLPPTEPDDELQLIAPDRVPAGAIVPLRAHVYAGLERPEGPTLVTAPTQVELRGADGRVWTRSKLRPGFAATLEGALRVPPGRHGRATLLARARHRDAELTVERELRIDREGVVTPAITPQPRELPPLRSLALSPVRALGELPFEAFDLRIRGGACVPEATCELLVHVGAAPVAVIAEPSASVSVVPSPGKAGSGGVATLFVTPHGPEAELSLRAEHEGRAVARAGVRLALALGADALASAPDVVRVGEPLHAALAAGQQGCIADAFRDGRWARTGSSRDCNAPRALPFAALEPGLWRVQLRSDRFGSDSAAVRSIYVASGAESPAGVTRALARHVLALEPGNDLARALLAEGEPGASAAGAQIGPARDDVRNSRYLLAVLDRGVQSLPAPASGHAAAVLRLQGARGQLRKLGLLALGACALTLAALLGQRGLHAAGEASRLLLAGGTEPGAVRRARMRMALRVIATLCALLLAFAVIAAYVVARAASP